PIVAIRLNNLAELFRDMGRLEDAEPMYQRALAIDMAALGPNHPNVATYLNNLAGLYKAREMWDKAAEHYTRAIAIDERALGGAAGVTRLTREGAAAARVHPRPPRAPLSS
ncbi:MAG: tetratricopeptide repeat protein, partial [Lutimaribacter sp.]